MEENTKLFSFDGYLNRRNFIINYLYVGLIASLIYATPKMLMLTLNIDLLYDYIVGIINTEAFPYWDICWENITNIIIGILLIPNITRRLRDIYKADDKNNIINTTVIISGCLLLPPMFILFGLKTGILTYVSMAGFIGIIMLMCTKGRISRKLPKSKIIKFNWGAFIGTWLWGIANKCYKALWMLPILFVPSGFWFMLICGMNGNKWLYEKRKEKITTEEEIDDFHYSQETQVLLWTIVAPIVSIVLLVGIFAIIGLAFATNVMNNPQGFQKLEQMQTKIVTLNAKMNFNNIEVTNDNYKFYIKPETWKELTPKQKISMYALAVKYSIMNDKKAEMAPIEYMVKTKMYSTFNNELLIEFNMPEKEYNKYKSEKIKIENPAAFGNSYYKINNYPSLP